MYKCLMGNLFSEFLPVNFMSTAKRHELHFYVFLQFVINDISHLRVKVNNKPRSTPKINKSQKVKKNPKY